MDLNYKNFDNFPLNKVVPGLSRLRPPHRQGASGHAIRPLQKNENKKRANAPGPV